MWSPDQASSRRLVRLLAVCGIAALCAGCFQPMYGEHTALNASGDSIVYALRGVEVSPLTTPRGTRVDRIGVEVRNNLIFALTGGTGTTSPTHRLTVTLGTSQPQLVVDVTSGRPDVQNFGLDASYTLTDLATGRIVVNSSAFARVSFNIPGQQQRFAGERGLRDAENRAAQVVAESIRNRLASYFTAGT